MEHQRKFEDILDEYNYTNPISGSLKNFSDWLLGISIGLAAALISLISYSDNNGYIFVICLIFIFVGIFFNGFIKYKIFTREIKMNTHFGKLKQIKIVHKATPQIESSEKDIEVKEKWDIAFSQYSEENEKILSIANLMVLSTYFTFFNILATGFTIIILVINKICFHAI